jgi:hypothetical protein
MALISYPIPIYRTSHINISADIHPVSSNKQRDTRLDPRTRHVTTHQNTLLFDIRQYSTVWGTHNDTTKQFNEAHTFLPNPIFDIPTG